MFTQRISSAALDALKKAHYVAHVNRLFITREELPRKAYREVKEVCARLGGHWNSASQAFLFSYDPTRTLEIVQATGEMPPRNPYAHFPTPDSISEDMIRYAFHLFGCNLCDGYRHGKPLHYCEYLPANLRILEPSAGDGAIARRVRQLYTNLGRNDYVLHCCELNPINREVLRQQGFHVVADDFLSYCLKPSEPFYDIVIMNPPFQGHEYIKHIEHAWNMLNPRRGRLVSLTFDNFLWHDDAPCREFKKLIRCYKEDAPWTYPAGRFKESGTPVQTVLISLIKEDQSWRIQPYAGFPNWYCYILNFHISQTRELNDRQWNIWDKVDRGELPETLNHPEWHRTRHILHEFFANAIQHAETDWWVEIQLDQASLHFMEAHFLKHGLLNCQCERHAQARHQLFEKVRQQKPCVQNVQAIVPPAGKSINLPIKGSTASTSTKRAILDPLVPGEYVQQTLFSF